MLNRFALIIIVFSLSGIVSFSPLFAEDATSSNDNDDKELVRVYEVFGMGCPACQGGLTKLVNKVQGVKEAKVNWKEQTMTVILKDGVEFNDDIIFEAIRKANFTPGKRLDTKLKKSKE